METNEYDVYNDNYEILYFQMNDNEQFIFYDNNKKIIKKLSQYRGINQFNLDKKEDEEIDKRMCILFFENKNNGIAHGISKLSTYLNFISKYKGILLIPNIIQNNILNLITDIFDRYFKILEKNRVYKIKNYFFSRYFDFMDNIAPESKTPNNKYPLIIYNNDIYWFRSFVNKYIDFNYPKKEIYEKIFVGKFEGQGINNNTALKPRSLLGCISKEMLYDLEKNGFKNIDPYEYSIHDVIYYIRNCKELVLSCGSCGRLYAPYIPKNVKIIYLMNIKYEMGINYDSDNNNEYNIQSDIILRFFNNYRICFYEYAPYEDRGVFGERIFRGNNKIIL
jgi:hypothetical protein